ncbi:hypothetical protein J2787_001073 [Chryseobacterium rhizosphaerae]|jgi:hypothetical protein|uniref:Uncharacterized protein n=1 Tax=Chryseobacterium rhizosphaerae TaxID=395937 RepID=A0AAE3Y5C7_9FLAO|nr:hypothetical protein [Chryseobacterium rhizosphaerae]
MPIKEFQDFLIGECVDVVSERLSLGQSFLLSVKIIKV